MLLASADTPLIHIVAIAKVLCVHSTHLTNLCCDRFASFHDSARSNSVSAHLLEVHHD
jgi:hypothetical protein